MEDGVLLTQDNKPIEPGQEKHYQFKLTESGTYWMHSHYKLQEQIGVEAPLIVKASGDDGDQQIVIMFQDFSFKKPQEILKAEQSNSDDHQEMSVSMKPDLNDVQYDAFLTNYHEDTKPEIIHVKKGKQVRLRFINGASASNFSVNTRLVSSRSACSLSTRD